MLLGGRGVCSICTIALIEQKVHPGATMRLLNCQFCNGRSGYGALSPQKLQSDSAMYYVVQCREGQCAKSCINRLEGTVLEF